MTIFIQLFSLTRFYYYFFKQALRKTIFEVLLGISSDEYFRKYDEFKDVSKERDLFIGKVADFNDKYSGIDLNTNTIKTNLDTNTSRLATLYEERKLYLGNNTKVDEKTQLLSKVQEELIATDIEISEVSIKLKNTQIEFDKISKLLEFQINEISEIEKIIFTNDKLNLFSFKVCPFCMTPHTPEENHCLCGAEIIDEDYEKFVYNSNEYKQILGHKNKSLETIQIALGSYEKDIIRYSQRLNDFKSSSEELTIKLKRLIGAIEFSGNSELIDALNDAILDVRKDIDRLSHLHKIAERKDSLDKELEALNSKYKSVKEELEKLQIKFEEENRSVIDDFNIIYRELLSSSSAGITEAEIDSDYMPIIDGGIYKNKSADVPVRLMYYLTILSLALKYKHVKHPKLLIIDTPEDSGIDEDNLNKDLLLINKALELGNAKDEKFQVILTTGIEKYPSEFDGYIFERFNKSEGNFILKERS